MPVSVIFDRARNPMGLEDQLTRLGLDMKEAKFYLAALELGQASVRVVADKAGISRTNAYDVFSRLLAKGTVTRVERGAGRRKRKYDVVAEDPSRLLHIVEEQRVVAEALLPDLRSVYSRSTVKPRVRLYEGLEGIRTVLYETLTCRSKQLLGILSMRDLLDVPGREETEEYIRRRIQAGVSLKVLRSREKDVGDIWPARASELRDLRYAPAGLVFTMTTWIYDEKVAIVSSRRENFGMTIESEEFARMQENLFSILWAVSEPDRDAGLPGSTTA
jgi:HTH-type transcriptional regulator, sugar sensing transcriptional regulator